MQAYFKTSIISDRLALVLKAVGLRLVLDALNPTEPSFSKIEVMGEGFILMYDDISSDLK
jgi:hypothetical protein